MLSNRSLKIFRLILLSSFCLVVAHCSYFFGEKKKETEVEYNGQIGSCIGRVNQTMADYFSRQEVADLTASKVDEFSQCYSEALESFVTYTKSGRVESNDFSAENIEQLIKRFHPEVQITADRIRGYIRLKAFLIGGDTETLSKQELRTIQELLPLITDGLKRLLPHRNTWMRIQPLSRDEEGYQQFDEAFEALKHEVGTVLSGLDAYQGRRNLNVVEISEFLIQELFGSEAASYLKYLNLIKAFKNFVVYESDETLKRGNLSLFSRQALLTYESLTRFDYFLKDESEDGIFNNIGTLLSFITRVPAQLKDSSAFKGVGLRALSDIYSSGEAVLTYAIRSQPNQTLPMDRLRDVLLALEDAEIMNGDLTAGTLSYFIRGFSRKWLNPGGPDDSAFSMEKVVYIRSLLNKWIRRQQIVNTLFANTNDDTVSLLNHRENLPNSPYLDEWYEMFRKNEDGKELSAHQWDSHNRIQYSRDITHFSYQELTVSNSISLLVELFMKPFNVNETNPLRYAVTDEQAQEIYESIRILGVEMAFMDSRVDDSGFRAFRETNNFSTQMNSDNQLDFYEGFEYLSVAMSAGQLADWIYEDLPKTNQCARDVTGVHGYQVIDANCVRQFLRENFLTYFGHLTTIANYWRQASNLEKTVFLRSLEVAARAGVIREKPYDLSEIRTTVSILAYLQAIFYMFDREHRNGFADGIETSPGDSELRRAEIHFRPLILDFLVNKKPEVLADNEWIIRRACGSDASQQEILDCMAPKIFIHLLKRGNLPLDANDICGSASFAWILFEINENVAFKETKADPGDVLKVFSALAKITLESHRGRVQDFILNRRQELFDSLSSPTPPDCREDPTQVFCRWGRELFCNENIFPNVYDFFRDNKYRLFTVPDYSENPEETTRQTMIEIYEEFTDGPRSTHCGFPPTFPEERFSGVQGAAQDCALGEEEDATLLERGGQTIHDVREGLRGLWESL